MRLEGHPKELAEELAKLPPEVRQEVVARAAGPDAARNYGYQYQGTPPQLPILKGLRQPLFDTVIVSPDGDFFGLDRDNAFVDKGKFPDGSQKMFGVDTNMTRDGNLGYPNEFTLRSVGLRVQECAVPADGRAVLAALGFRLVFGADITYLRLGPSCWKPVLLHPFADPNEPEKCAAAFGAVLETFHDHGGLWPWFQHDIAPITEAARRAEERYRYLHVNPDGSLQIGPTESFRIETSLRKRPRLSGRVVLKLLLEERLHVQL